MNVEQFKKEYGNALAIARHADNINRMPFWARILHFILISYRCPCCQMGKKIYGIRKLYKF